MDTGWKSPTSYSDSSGTFFTDQWIVEGSGYIIFVGSSATQTLSGYSGTINGIVTGAEVFLDNTYGTINGSATFDIQISNNGGSTFSSAINTGTLGTTQTNREFLGSSTNLWGLDWYGFNNLSSIKIKGKNGTGQSVSSRHAYVKIHYRDVESSLKLKGTKMHLKGGKFTIK
tara:strand:- start:1182 stop:1697 length:516 start_codon:yes stop_codon:yes gene_type:complete